MTTHLFHVPMDMRRFNRWAAQRDLVRNGSFDPGCLLHVLLSGMFGKGVLQPFRLLWSERRRNAALYGYADRDLAGLRRTAEETATPDCIHVIDPRNMRSKRMPAEFERGRRLGFDVRVRPVRRLLRALPDGDRNKAAPKGTELDAFQLEMIRGSRPEASGPGSATRESIYTKWLAERLDGAAALEECRLAGFRRTRAVRRKGKGPEGPDAVLHGTLAVFDPERFGEILRNGIGRHRAYGYGMLLLRPPNCKAQEQ